MNVSESSQVYECVSENAYSLEPLSFQCLQHLCPGVHSAVFQFYHVPSFLQDFSSATLPSLVSRISLTSRLPAFQTWRTPAERL